MPRPVISVENLSKAYRIGLKDEMPDTLMGAMKNVATAPWRNFHRLRRLNTATATAGRATPADSSPLAASRSPLASNAEHVEAATTPDETDTLWALRDVSFEVNEGDVVGIIGRNGAGKSTLLKILSRITEPTSGRAVIRGRVSSLLEVGTGFHPELTGRENIYMNGTILGMRKKEIDRKFDEIVEFSGVGKFLDTATKRYSSGMQVRLAFSVAAHLEPEILIVDEVLAVGDQAFQDKCKGKMKDVAESGRTVLLVSHNQAAIASLCERVVYLQNGQIRMVDDAKETLQLYRGDIESEAESLKENANFRTGCGELRIVGCDVISSKAVITVGSSVGIAIALNKHLKKGTLILSVFNFLGQKMAVMELRLISIGDSSASDARALVKIGALPLEPGTYSVEAILYSGDGRLQDRVEHATNFLVHPCDIGKYPSRRNLGGLIALRYHLCSSLDPQTGSGGSLALHEPSDFS